MYEALRAHRHRKGFKLSRVYMFHSVMSAAAGPKCVCILLPLPQVSVKLYIYLTFMYNIRVCFTGYTKIMSYFIVCLCHQTAVIEIIVGEPAPPPEISIKFAVLQN